MKILKKGKKQTPTILDKKITCSECGCKFQLESEEEARLVADWRDGNYYEITCPQCQHQGTYQATLFTRSSSVE
jgi:RNase P subunit RPR2